MNIDYDFVAKTITISCDNHNQMDNLRILLKSIKDYGKVLNGVDDHALSLTKVIDVVSEQMKL